MLKIKASYILLFFKDKRIYLFRIIIRIIINILHYIHLIFIGEKNLNKNNNMMTNQL